MTDIINSTTESVKDFVTPIFTNLVTAVVIILVGLILGRILGKFLQRLLHDIELNRIVKSAVHLEVSVEETIGSLVSYFIYFISVILALDQIGLTTYILNIVALAVLAVIILSIFLAIKDFMPNLFAGLYIHSKRLIKEDERIRFKTTEGKVHQVNLVETKIITDTGDIILIPNSMLIKTELVKLSQNGKKHKKKED